MSASEFLALPDDVVEFVLADVLPVGGLSMIIGKPKVGKTVFCRSLALAVARGGSFIGKTIKPGPVICWQLEGTRAGMKSHFRKMG